MEYYTPEEKKIFINSFIKKTEGSRIAFDQYILAFYQKHHVLAEGVTKFAPGVPCNKFLKPDAVFDTHQKMWDENDNIVTYFLSHRDFEVNSSNLRRLNLVHPDWTYKNKDGMNAVFLLAKKGQFELLKKVGRDFNLDVNAKDAQGNYFTKDIFKIKTFYEDREINLDLFVKIMSRFMEVKELMSEYPEHFEPSFNKIKKISDEWKESWELVLALYEKSIMIDMDSRGKEALWDGWNEVNQQIENILLVAKLEKHLVSHPDNKKMKL